MNTVPANLTENSRGATRRPLVVKMLRRLFGLSLYERLYDQICSRMGDRSFAQEAVKVLRFGIGIRPSHWKRVPADGPLVVVANHPSGAMEGLVLPAFLELIRSRADVKTLAHVWFESYPALARDMFLVDPAARGRARARGRSVLAATIRWVRQGRTLLAFPAGQVARFDWRTCKVADPPWNPGIARIVRATRATVLPVHLEARNGPLYHLLSLMHPRLGTLWLIRELLRKRGTRMRIRVGRPIRYEELPETNGDVELTAYLRQEVASLVDRPGDVYLRRSREDRWRRPRNEPLWL